MNKIKGLNKPYIIGLNKIDISREKYDNIKDELKGFENIIALSTKTREGIEELKNTLERIFNVSSFDNAENQIIVNERHKELLERTKQELTKALEITEKGESLDIAAINLKEATTLLGNITGKDASSDVVNKIFEKFCLGK